MAKTKPEASWTLEDLPRLAEQLDGLASIIGPLKDLVEKLETRLLVVEQSTASLEPGESTLPNEVVAGLSPAQVYQTALQGAILGIVMTNPTLGSMNQKHQEARAKVALDFANAVLVEACRRLPTKKRAG